MTDLSTREVVKGAPPSITWRSPIHTTMTNFRDAEGQSALCDEGVGVRYRIRLDMLWCHQFFLLSQDSNAGLHMSGEGGIVQGIAIIAMVNAIISRLAPGHAMFNMSFDMVRPVKVGKVVTVAVVCVRSIQQGTRSIVRYALSVQVDGQYVVRPQNIRVVKLRKLARV